LQAPQRVFVDPSPPLDLRFTPDGGRLLATDGNSAAGWDLAGRRAIPPLLGQAGGGLGGRFSPHGSRRAGAAPPPPVRAWGAGSGKEVAVYRGSVNPLQEWPERSMQPVDLTFSPDGARVASRLPGEVRLHVWDPATGKRVLVLEGLVNGVSVFRFTPDGKAIV